MTEVAEAITEYERVARERALVEPIELGSEIEMPKWAERERLTAEYSYAIPNAAALDAIAAEGPIIEIGAGNGYWTWELEQRGADILAFDPDPFQRGQYRDSRMLKTQIMRLKWGEVQEGDHTVVADHPDRRSLLLCWPSYGLPWATEAVEAFKGETVFYVGEFGGCTGDEMLVPRLCMDFKLCEEIAIPRFYGLHDFVSVWRR